MTRRVTTLCLAALATGCAGARPRAPAAEVRLDSRHATLALEYLHSDDPALIEDLARTPATSHLLAHARAFDNEDFPRDSARALAEQLVAPGPRRDAAAATCARSLEFFEGPLVGDQAWIEDVTRYLPAGRPLRASLFLTFGYDIGVAYGDGASLNCGHRHFAGDPHELVYFAIHELHHAGFMAYQPAIPLERLHTCADLRRFVDLAMQLEGMAVLATLPRRRAEGTTALDGDARALEDEPEMRREEARYRELLQGLEARGQEPLDAAAWAVIERLSGERLWYRVGARMAQRIERARGRAALVALIEAGAERFVQAAAEVSPRQP